MWIKTYDGRFINTDKLASIQSERSSYANGTFIYCIYGAGVISYLEQYDVMDKNTICIFKISDTNERKVKYVYNNVLRELKEAFYGEAKFICIPELTEKYSKEFDAGEEG